MEKSGSRRQVTGKQKSGGSIVRTSVRNTAPAVINGRGRILETKARENKIERKREMDFYRRGER